MRRARAVLALALVVAGALSGCGSAPMQYRQTYLQFNACGNACNDGGPAVIANLRNAIAARQPFVVTLNELCENQYTTLRSGLDDYQGRFDPTGPTCHNGARYGNALLVRAATVDLVGSWALPTPAGDEARRLMCLSTQLAQAPLLVLCVTHISNVSGNVGAEVSAVATILNGLSPDDAVLLGGDFNTDPADPRLDPLYDPCYAAGRGRFDEADSANCASRAAIDAPAGSDVLNEDTFNRHKYDYVFLSHGDWSSPSAQPTSSPSWLSDHDALWATAVLRSSA